MQDVLEIETARTLSDATGPKPGTRTIGRSGVKGGAEEGDIISFLFAGETGEVGETAKGRDAGEDRVGLSM